MPILDSSVARGNGIIAPKPTERFTEIMDVTVENATGFKPVSVDLRWLPKVSLLQHIAGSAWVVDYYAQVLTADSDLSGQQLTVSGVYQQYTKIAGLELRVSSALSSSQTDTSGAMEAVGTAMVYPFLRPNVGDMFLAPIPDGRYALFRINSSVQKSISKETCYEISYALDTDASDKINNLESKVVKTFYYKKDYLNYGKNPLLIKEEAEDILKLERFEYMLARDYVGKFYSDEYNTYLIPGQPTETYDHFINRFLATLISSQQDHRILNHRRHNLNDEVLRDIPNLWTMLADRNAWLLGSVFDRYCLVSVKQYFYQGKYSGLRWSGLDKLVFPQGEVAEQYRSVDMKFTRDTYKGYIAPSFVQANLPDIQPNAVSSYTPPDGDEWMDPSPDQDPYAPLTLGLDPKYALVATPNLNSIADVRFLTLKPVTQDDYYVLSSDFWLNTDKQNALEKMVRSYLNRESVDVGQLVGFCEVYRRWGLVEQFYFIPMILLMIKNVLRGVA